MTGARGVCIYVRMYVCIMCKEDPWWVGGTAGFFLCLSRYVSVRWGEREDWRGRKYGLIWLSLRGGCFPASISWMIFRWVLKRAVFLFVAPWNSSFSTRYLFYLLLSVFLPACIFKSKFGAFQCISACIQLQSTCIRVHAEKDVWRQGHDGRNVS